MANLTIQNKGEYICFAVFENFELKYSKYNFDFTKYRFDFDVSNNAAILLP